MTFIRISDLNFNSKATEKIKPSIHSFYF